MILWYRIIDGRTQSREIVVNQQHGLYLYGSVNLRHIYKAL
jgi:hypothetical protein